MARATPTILTAAATAAVTSALWYGLAAENGPTAASPARTVARSTPAGVGRGSDPVQVRAPAQRTDAALLARIAELEAQLARARAPAAETEPGPPASAFQVTGAHRAAAAWLSELLPERFAGMSAGEVCTLRELDLRGVELTDDALRHVASMTNLRDLVLRGTAVGDLALGHLSGLPALETLSLRGTRIEGATLGALPRGLIHVDLTSTAVSDADLAGLLGMGRLENLDLMGTEVTDGAVEVLGNIPGLAKIELDGTAVTDAGIERLLGWRPEIRRIEARGTAVSGELAQSLRHRYPGLELVLY